MRVPVCVYFFLSFSLSLSLLFIFSLVVVANQLGNVLNFIERNYYSQIRSNQSSFFFFVVCLHVCQFLLFSIEENSLLIGFFLIVCVDVHLSV